MATLKRNFIVEFANTSDGWDSSVQMDYQSAVAFGNPAAPATLRQGSDPVRRGLGTVWVPEPSLGGADADAPWVWNENRINAPLESFYYRDFWPEYEYEDYLLVAAPGSHTTLGPMLTSPATVERGDRYHARPWPAGYASTMDPNPEWFPAPHGCIYQWVRVEANQNLLPLGGAEETVWDSITHYPDLPMWRNWCMQTYYGRHLGGDLKGHFIDYYDHATTYESPFTPVEWLLSPNERLKATTKFKYNFYINEYENLIAGLNPSSHTLYPHLYTMYFEKARSQGLTFVQYMLGMDMSVLDIVAGAGASLGEPGHRADEIYNDFVTLNRAIPDVFTDTVRLERYDSFGRELLSSAREEKAGEKDKGQYFDKWSQTYRSLYAAGSAPAPQRAGVEILKRMYTNALFTLAGAYQTRQYNSSKILFPMYSEIFFPLGGTFNPPDTMALDAHDTLLDGLISFNSMQRIWSAYHHDDFVAGVIGLSDLGGTPPGASMPPYTTSTKAFAENHERAAHLGSPENVAIAANKISGTERRVYDLGALFDELQNPDAAGAADIFYTQSFVQLKSPLSAKSGEAPDGIIRDSNITGNTDETLLFGEASATVAEFVDNINNNLIELSSNYVRAYSEILNGKEAFSTNLFYRINKYERIGNARGERLQSIFIPHNKYTNVFEYADTQLRYNNTYEYEVLVYRAVVGSKYNFLELSLPRGQYGRLRTFGPSSPLIPEIPGGPTAPYGPAESWMCPECVPPYRTAPGYPGPQMPISFREPGDYTIPPGGDEPTDFLLNNPVFAPDLDPPPPPDPSSPDYDPTAPLPDTSSPALWTHRRWTYFPDRPDENPFFAELLVRTEPSVLVVELPYIASELPWNTLVTNSGQTARVPDMSFGIGTILDRPGTGPDVDIIPYRGVNNKLLFNLTTGAGQVFAPPVSLNAAEAEYMSRITGFFGVNYQNDDPARAFEVYRLDSLPTDYQDFSGHRIQTITTEDPLLGYRRSDAASYVDEILPNQKYYYMIRSLDIHGHPSHPSEIYEVELTDNEGAVYPVVRVVDPAAAQERKTPLKKMKRFLQIKPTAPQTLFNIEETFAPDGVPLEGQPPGSSAPVTNNIALGYQAESVWGNRYKIRLTSKLSGKKIDLNIRFKKEYADQRSDSEEAS